MAPNFSKNAILKGSVDYFCLVCEAYLTTLAQTEEHIAKCEHLSNLSFITSVPELEEDCIKKIKNRYFCELCNKIFPVVARARLHTNEALHIENTLSLVLKRSGNNIIAFNKTVINDEAWNSLLDNACIICNTSFDDSNAHKSLPSHIVNLIQMKIEFDEEKNIYRKIDETSFQCLSCNEVQKLSYMNKHFDSTQHKNNFYIMYKMDNSDIQETQKSSITKEDNIEKQDEEKIFGSGIIKQKTEQKESEINEQEANESNNDEVQIYEPQNAEPKPDAVENVPIMNEAAPEENIAINVVSNMGLLDRFTEMTYGYTEVIHIGGYIIESVNISEDATQNVEEPETDDTSTEVKDSDEINTQEVNNTENTQEVNNTENIQQNSEQQNEVMEYYQNDEQKNNAIMSDVTKDDDNLLLLNNQENKTEDLTKIDQVSNENVITQTEEKVGIATEAEANDVGAEAKAHEKNTLSKSHVKVKLEEVKQPAKGSSDTCKNTQKSNTCSVYKYDVKAEEKICKMLNANKYIGKDENGRTWCILCDWSMEIFFVAEHLKGVHHQELLKMHTKRQEKLKNNYTKHCQEQLRKANSNKENIVKDIEILNKNNVQLECKSEEGKELVSPPVLSDENVSINGVVEKTSEVVSCEHTTNKSDKPNPINEPTNETPSTSKDEKKKETDETEKDLVKIPAKLWIETVVAIENLMFKDYIVNNKVCVNIFSYFFVSHVMSNIMKCFACNEDILMRDFDTHIATHRHNTQCKEALVIQMDSELIREIQPGDFHCGLCNIVLKGWPDMEQHLQSPVHRECKTNSSWRLQQYQAEVATGIYPRTKSGILVNMFSSL